MRTSTDGVSAHRTFLSSTTGIGKATKNRPRCVSRAEKRNLSHFSHPL